SSALCIHSAILCSFSLSFFSSRCWSAMEIATCVFTCRSWFCMSRMTCLIIFSGSSALSIKSFRLARIRVVTRSSNAIVHLCPFLSLDLPPPPPLQLLVVHQRIDHRQQRPAHQDHHVDGKTGAQQDKRQRQQSSADEAAGGEAMHGLPHSGAGQR